MSAFKHWWNPGSNHAPCGALIGKAIGDRKVDVTKLESSRSDWRDVNCPSCLAHEPAGVSS